MNFNFKLYKKIIIGFFFFLIAADEFGWMERTKIILVAISMFGMLATLLIVDLHEHLFKMKNFLAEKFEEISKK